MPTLWEPRTWAAGLMLAVAVSACIRESNGIYEVGSGGSSGGSACSEGGSPIVTPPPCPGGAEAPPTCGSFRVSLSFSADFRAVSGGLSVEAKQIPVFTDTNRAERGAPEVLPEDWDRSELPLVLVRSCPCSPFAPLALEGGCRCALAQTG